MKSLFAVAIALIVWAVSPGVGHGAESRVQILSISIAPADADQAGGGPYFRVTTSVRVSALPGQVLFVDNRRAFSWRIFSPERGQIKINKESFVDWGLIKQSDIIELRDGGHHIYSVSVLIAYEEKNRRLVINDTEGILTKWYTVDDSVIGELAVSLTPCVGRLTGSDIQSVNWSDVDDAASYRLRLSKIEGASFSIMVGFEGKNVYKH
jgi:hypothetical protein